MALIDEQGAPALRAKGSAVAAPVGEKSRVRQTIERIWSEMAPFATHMDETVAWRETGADSLLTLQFLVRLQQELEHPLSFDMFTLDMTVGEIIRAIELSQEPGGGKTSSAGKTTLFLIPGILGDEPKLAEFRRSLADSLHFETLRVLDLDQSASVLADMRAVAADLVDKINAAQPEGPLYLAGYSMGGMLAFQAACDLIAAGRDVRFLGILDAMYGRPTGAAHSAPAEGMEGDARVAAQSPFKVREKETLTVYLDRAVYGVLLRLGRLEWARRWTVSRLAHNDMATNDRRRQYLLPRFRGLSIFTWRPTPCPARTLLIVSDEFERKTSTDTWAHLCPNLTIQRVPGDHGKIFEPEALAKLNPVLLAELDRAQAG